ncbi:hypothetical protein BDV25DRAFT_43840 [Aspergillus avenaceus]|uniref:Uncharacterized protein n=1 Tax=Aspergillus avenaceus TaxID=36643 RepID=A0A5N6TLD1_ASPAV|nr:hypothetical protein BDV25DRAFT_43840 [Aspergillus avenaceus]
MHDQGSRNKTSTKRLGWLALWTWELGSAVLSILRLTLLIGFLAKIKQGACASWQYTAMPNTVVSITDTAGKAAMLMSVPSCLSQLKWHQYAAPTRLYRFKLLGQGSRGSRSWPSDVSSPAAYHRRWVDGAHAGARPLRPTYPDLSFAGRAGAQRDRRHPGGV